MVRLSIAGWNIQKLTGFNAAQPVFLHDELRRIPQAIFAQRPFYFGRDAFSSNKQWNNREFHSDTPFLLQSFFFPLAHAEE
jgi:hypothetical protein